MKQLKMMLKKTLYVMDTPQRVLCVVVFFLICLGSALECLGVSAIIPLVSIIQNPDAIGNNAFLGKWEWLANLSYSQVITYVGGGVICIYVFKNMYFIFLSWVRAKFSRKIGREISVKMFSSYLSRGYQFFLDINYGEFARGVSGDAGSVSSVIFSVFHVVAEALTILFVGTFMLLTDWKIAVVALMLAFVCLLLIYFVFRKRMYENGIQSRKYTAKVNQALSQSYQGVKDVLLLRKQKHFIYEYESNNIKMQEVQCRQLVAAESPAYVIEAICVAGLMVTVCIRLASGGTDEQFLAVLASFAVGAFRILPSLGRISSSLNSLTNSMPSINALYEQVIQAEEHAKGHPEMLIETEKPKLKFGLISMGSSYYDENHDKKEEAAMPRFHKVLELKDVSFWYKEELGYILQHINLTIKKGQSVAFIGASGAGKSTLVDILLGLLVPREGAIYMDGIGITDIPEKWADTVGYVPQAVFLADASIKSNVAFGESEKEIDEDRVWRALKKAELEEFIAALPEGIESYVGDRGVRLSGGQRQRIAIARALYHEPEILVLDEATSALDNDTETAIMSAIDSLQGQVTMIIVAHRLTTVKNCDIIYEVNDRRLIERDKADVLSGAK